MVDLHLYAIWPLTKKGANERRRVNIADKFEYRVSGGGKCNLTGRCCTSHLVSIESASQVKVTGLVWGFPSLLASGVVLFALGTPFQTDPPDFSVLFPVNVFFPVHSCMSYCAFALWCTSWFMFSLLPANHICLASLQSMSRPSLVEIESWMILLKLKCNDVGATPV